jgi:hypothetical protein
MVFAMSFIKWMMMEDGCALKLRLLKNGWML